MKSVSPLLLVFGLVAAGCNKGSAPGGPTPNGTTTSTIFTTALKASNEVPSVSNAEADVAGTAVIMLKATKDASGVVTAATADFKIDVSGFPAGSVVTMAHIHPGGAGANGGIAVNTGLASGEVTLVDGAGAVQKNGVTVPADVAQGILKAPGSYYFNVHSVMNAGGVIRGQLDGSGGGTAPAPGPDPYPYAHQP